MITKIKDLGTVITGNTPKTSDSENYASCDIPFVKPSDLNEDEITQIDFTEFYISEYARDKARVVPPNSVFMTCIGIIGKLGINQRECAFNQQINVVVPDENKCLPEYLAYALINMKSILQATANAPVVPILNKSQFGDIEIDLPNLEVQEEIVSKLRKIDCVINNRDLQLSKLDELVKSRFIELFGNIDEYQNKLELQDICVKITDGSHNPPAGVEKSENYMISSQNIHDNIIDYKDVRYLNDSDFETENKRTAITPGDVLLTIVGAIGRSAVVKDDLNITCQRSVCVIHPNRDKVNSIFLKYMLDSISDKIVNEARGAAQKGIYLKQVKKLQIICPSFDLQTRFATFVEQTDKLKLEIQESLEKLETLKKSLMQKYFG